MNLSIDEFFKKHDHLLMSVVARECGILRQRLTDMRRGVIKPTKEQVDRMNSAIKKITLNQLADKIK